MKRFVHAYHQYTPDLKPKAVITTACGISANIEVWTQHSVNTLKCTGVGFVRMVEPFVQERLSKTQIKQGRPVNMIMNKLVTCERCKRKLEGK